MKYIVVGGIFAVMLYVARELNKEEREKQREVNLFHE